MSVINPALSALPLPKSVRVSAYDIAIEEMSHLAGRAEGIYGDWSHLELTIRIDVSVNTICILDTLLHEINHVIFWAYGIEDEDEEERLVATMATAWTQIYRDNPELLKWISGICGVKGK